MAQVMVVVLMLNAPLNAIKTLFPLVVIVTVISGIVAKVAALVVGLLVVPTALFMFFSSTFPLPSTPRARLAGPIITQKAFVAGSVRPVWSLFPLQPLNIH